MRSKKLYTREISQPTIVATNAHDHFLQISSSHFAVVIHTPLLDAGFI